MIASHIRVCCRMITDEMTALPESFGFTSWTVARVLARHRTSEKEALAEGLSQGFSLKSWPLLPGGGRKSRSGAR